MRNKLIRVSVSDVEIQEIDSWAEKHGLAKEGRAASLRIMASMVVVNGSKPSEGAIRKGIRRKLEKQNKT